MSKESVEIEIHRAVEEAIENGISPRDFIKMVSVSWSQIYKEKDENSSKYFDELSKNNGGY